MHPSHTVVLCAILALTAGAHGALITTEIMYNPNSSPDNDWEYVEIFNTSSSDTVNLAGWVLDDNDGDALTGSNIPAGTVPPRSAVVLHNADANTLSGLQNAWGTAADFLPVTDWSALSNGGDRIGLWADFASYDGQNFDNAIIDVDYEDDGGWPEDDGVSSVFLNDLAADPNEPTSWTLSFVGDPSGGYQSNPAGDDLEINVGSPGLVVPEPVSLALTAVGGLALLRRRR